MARTKLHGDWRQNDPIWRERREEEPPVATADRDRGAAMLDAADKALRNLLIAIRPWRETYHGCEIIACAEASQRSLQHLRDDGTEDER